MPGRDFAAQQHLFMCHIFRACGTAVQSPESGGGGSDWSLLSQVYVIKKSCRSQLASLCTLAQALSSVLSLVFSSHWGSGWGCAVPPNYPSSFRRMWEGAGELRP